MLDTESLMRKPGHGRHLYVTGRGDDLVELPVRAEKPRWNVEDDSGVSDKHFMN